MPAPVRVRVRVIDCAPEGASTHWSPVAGLVQRAGAGGPVRSAEGVPGAPAPAQCSLDPSAELIQYAPLPAGLLRALTRREKREKGEGFIRTAFIGVSL